MEIEFSGDQCASLKAIRNHLGTTENHLVLKDLLRLCGLWSGVNEGQWRPMEAHMEAMDYKVG